MPMKKEPYFLAEPSHAFIPSGPTILPGVNALVREVLAALEGGHG